MTQGLTLTWMAGELGETECRLKKWMYKDPHFPRPGRGAPEGYSRAALRRLRAIQAGYQIWPHGPIDCILDWIESDQRDERWRAGP